MKGILPLPLFAFLRQACALGGLSAAGWVHALPWLLKTTLFEPLRWVEVLRHEKALSQASINPRPIFILGHYRSGTTLLVQYFMQDQRLGHMSLFESVMPELMLSFEDRLTPIFSRATRILRMKNHFHRCPLQWQFPGEDDVGMTATMHPCGAQWALFFPRKNQELFRKYVLMDNLSREESAAWTEGYLALLRKLSLRHTGKPLVLKSPPNTARIALLLSLFPEARFVFISRSPRDVYGSMLGFWQSLADHYVLGSMKDCDTREIILSNYAGMMSRYLEQRAMIRPGQLYELHYRDLVEKPVEVLQEAYDTLGIGDFGPCRAAMDAFAGTQKQYHAQEYPQDDDTLKLLAQRWRPFLAQWA